MLNCYLGINYGPNNELTFETEITGCSPVGALKHGSNASGDIPAGCTLDNMKY